MAHVEATKRRDEWALKSEALLKAGKMEAARKALARADYWQHQKRLLEPQASKSLRRHIQRSP